MDSALAIGSRAPDFTLAAANQPGEVQLFDVIKRGPVVVEFLRGTW